MRNGTGYVKKEGTEFVWNVVVPQMGYWLAAFPSSSGAEAHLVLRSPARAVFRLLVCCSASRCFCVFLQGMIDSKETQNQMFF